MKRDLFRDRHPLLYAFFHHCSVLAGLAFVLMVLLEIGTFSHLIVVKIRHLGQPKCSIGRNPSSTAASSWRR